MVGHGDALQCPIERLRFRWRMCDGSVEHSLCCDGPWRTEISFTELVCGAAQVVGGMRRV